MMRTIIFDNKIIEYELNRKAKKNINIYINPNSTLKVSAPRWALISEIEKVLYEKEKWILKNLEKQKHIDKNIKTNSFENNSKIWFKGKEYNLFFEESKKNFVFLGEDQIITFTKNKDDKEYAKNVLMKWIKNVATNDFKNAIDCYRDEMVKKYKIPEYELQIRSMKTRWGTCTPSKNKITLNLSLIYAPKEELEYVALHELTHFLEIRHNKHFYGIMEEYMPDYKARRTLLNKEYGQICKD